MDPDLAPKLGPYFPSVPYFPSAPYDPSALYVPSAPYVPSGSQPDGQSARGGEAVGSTKSSPGANNNRRGPDGDLPPISRPRPGGSSSSSSDASARRSIPDKMSPIGIGGDTRGRSGPDKSPPHTSPRRTASMRKRTLLQSAADSDSTWDLTRSRRTQEVPRAPMKDGPLVPCWALVTGGGDLPGDSRVPVDMNGGDAIDTDADAGDHPPTPPDVIGVYDAPRDPGDITPPRPDRTPPQPDGPDVSPPVPGPEGDLPNNIKGPADIGSPNNVEGPIHIGDGLNIADDTKRGDVSGDVSSDASFSNDTLSSEQNVLHEMRLDDEGMSDDDAEMKSGMFVTTGDYSNNKFLINVVNNILNIFFKIVFLKAGYSFIGIMSGLFLLSISSVFAYKLYHSTNWSESGSFYHAPNSIMATWTDDDVNSSHPLALSHSGIEMGDNPFG